MTALLGPENHEPGPATKRCSTVAKCSPHRPRSLLRRRDAVAEIARAAASEVHTGNDRAGGAAGNGPATARRLHPLACLPKKGAFWCYTATEAGAATAGRNRGACLHRMDAAPLRRRAPMVRLSGDHAWSRVPPAGRQALRRRTLLLCRHCYRLAHASQREDGWGQHAGGQNKLRRRLGCEPGRHPHLRPGQRAGGGGPMSGCASKVLRPKCARMKPS
jgi:hypothetical protein